MLLIGSAGTVLGCLSGGMVSFFLIPVVVKSLGIKSGYVGADMVRFHPAVLLATILLVGVTIFLASQKPIKMAADISPIEALGYCPTHKNVKVRRAGKGKVIARLSMEQFTKDKKRTAVVLLSLATSLSVYLCIVTMLDSQAARTIVSNYMDTDMVIQNDTACKEKSEDSIPYGKEKDEYQNHPENFGSSLIGIDEQEFDYLNNSLEHPINKGDFRSGKACIVYRNGLDLADADIIGKNVTCALYEDQQTTKTFTIEGITDENYYTALLGYPPTIIACDQVVKTFANHPITLKTSIKYHKEYDRDTEQEILALLEENDNAKDFSWEPKIEDADEIEKAQGNMPQLGISLLVCTMVPVLTWIVLEKNGTVVERIKGVE